MHMKKRHLFTDTVRLLSGIVLVGAVIAATGQNARSNPGIIGKWKWVSTKTGGEKVILPGSNAESVVLVYKPDSTRDEYKNGVLVAKDQPFSIRRQTHPSGSGVIDVLVCADATGLVEPYQTVWLKGQERDTLVYMSLDPTRNFEPYVYSVFCRVKE